MPSHRIVRELSVSVQSRSRSRSLPRSYRKRHRTSCHHHRSRCRERKNRSSCRHRRCSRSASYQSSFSRTSFSSSGSTLPRKTALERTRPVNPSPSTCLGVFGLSIYTQETDLRNIFERFGTIHKVSIVYDAKTKSSRGFGFVYFQDLEEASVAKVQCNGMVIHERTIRVDYSVTDKPHAPTPGVYMGDRNNGNRSSRHSYSYRGRSYDEDYYHGRSRRSRSRSSHRRRSSRHRRHCHRAVTRSRSRSMTYTSRDSRHSSIRSG
ncbi:transformer-2 protein homolog beta-like [Sabethes cyaneus]|uniref:transformer-2 protein homolog beta-like n=1 Tax=Sabethes cyaneus TaxID=53552 RepID=UPI00237ED1A3|nr:transformer-2 protein homolog beta-like [Sabethes cyaneus]